MNGRIVDGKDTVYMTWVVAAASKSRMSDIGAQYSNDKKLRSTPNNGLYFRLLQLDS